MKIDVWLTEVIEEYDFPQLVFESVGLLLVLFEFD